MTFVGVLVSMIFILLLAGLYISVYIVIYKLITGE